MELLSIFVNNLLPVVIIAGVGYIAGKRFQLEASSLSTLLFYVFSPALVFHELYHSQINGSEFATLFFLTAFVQISTGALAYLLMRWRKVDSVHAAGFIIAAICFNAGNFGLSLVSFAFEPAVFQRAIVIFVANVVMNYSLGVYFASSGRRSPWMALNNVLKTPAIYAAMAAFVLRGLGIGLPLTLERSIGLLGDVAIPGMLVLLGLQLSMAGQLGRWRLVLSGTALRLLVSPLIAIGLALMMSLNYEAASALIIQSAMPTAVLTIILTTQFRLDRDLALSLIISTTLFSMITLTVLILLMQKNVLGL